MNYELPEYSFVTPHHTQKVTIAGSQSGHRAPPLPTVACACAPATNAGKQRLPPSSGLRHLAFPSKKEMSIATTTKSLPSKQQLVILRVCWVIEKILRGLTKKGDGTLQQRRAHAIATSNQTFLNPRVFRISPQLHVQNRYSYKVGLNLNICEARNVRAVVSSKQSTTSKLKLFSNQASRHRSMQGLRPGQSAQVAFYSLTHWHHAFRAHGRS